VAGLWFYPGTPVSSTNKMDHNDITEILLKVELNTINPNPYKPISERQRASRLTVRHLD